MAIGQIAWVDLLKLHLVSLSLVRFIAVIAIPADNHTKSQEECQ